MEQLEHNLEKLRQEIALLGDREIIERGRLLRKWTTGGKRPTNKPHPVVQAWYDELDLLIAEWRRRHPSVTKAGPRPKRLT
jgi:hypothetical protein